MNKELNTLKKEDLMCIVVTNVDDAGLQLDSHGFLSFDVDDKDNIVIAKKDFRTVQKILGWNDIKVKNILPFEPSKTWTADANLVCGAAALADLNGDGLSDEQFAEFFVLAYKMWKTNDSHTVLTADDMNHADVDAITNKLNETLKEILFDEDVCTLAWWKN